VTEYAFLVRTCELSADEAPATAGDRGRVIAEKLAQLAEPLQRSLESFDHGGWKVLSHDLLREGDSLVVTFLICRPRRGNS
jgi:hypothetical protein